jgi:hypothetical protein
VRRPSVSTALLHRRRRGGKVIGGRGRRCHTGPIRERRWDTDERGRGIGDAQAFVDGAAELMKAMQTSDWVAEDADAHLLPHLERACASLPLELVHAETTPDAAFEISVAWTGSEGAVSAVHESTFALIGSIAESATYIRHRRTDRAELVFDVVTGMLQGDTQFASHGHTLRVRVSGALGA